MTENAARSRSVRLFVGVPVRDSPEVTSLLSRLGEFGRAVRATRAEQLHVTLKFLGDADESSIGELADEMTEALSGSEAFDYTLRGLGAFPSASRPSVVWVGVDQGARFASLAERIESAAGAVGFSREGRKFHPHVTLGRVRFRPPPELTELLREMAESVFGPRRAEEVVLFHSDLGRGGSVYTPVSVVRLASV